MHKQGLSLDSAYEFVKSKRPVIDPNINFIRQLQKFEALLRSRQKSHSPSRAKLATPLLLRPPPCSRACSVQTHSAPLIACAGPSSKQHHPVPPQVFTFSSFELQPKQSSTSTSSQMEVSSPSPTTALHFAYPCDHPVPQVLSSKSDSVPLSPHLQRERKVSPQPEERLSPCSLSQTAASPSPVCHPPAINVLRPGSLPLLQITTPLTPHHDLSSSNQRTFLLPSPVQNPSTPFLSSPALKPSTPQFLFLPQGPEEGTEASALNYPEIPRTPREHRQFEFFGADSPGPSGGSIPSLHHTASPPRSPFLGPDMPFPNPASLPHSPVSPLGFPLSPLHSPLPSCG
ncbi:dual specificity phosphatase 28 [Elysia marginata]|uniref:Dual specificity phosphatase 28 n=1 Tax=Elysia marginata TaxID=1093978 RepID=A0AAV4J2I9_9GAST|nr:dual specificity phosphatase 28 [Elysia marginata]